MTPDDAARAELLVATQQLRAQLKELRERGAAAGKLRGGHSRKRSGKRFEGRAEAVRALEEKEVALDLRLKEFALLLLGSMEEIR